MIGLPAGLDALADNLRSLPCALQPRLWRLAILAQRLEIDFVHFHLSGCFSQNPCIQSSGGGNSAKCGDMCKSHSSHTNEDSFMSRDHSPSNVRLPLQHGHLNESTNISPEMVLGAFKQQPSISTAGNSPSQAQA